MSFLKDKEDDEDFVLNPNYQSNLSSLFGIGGNDGNSSLTYTAPKQPKQQSKASSTPSSKPSPTSSTVIIAKSVQSFKMAKGTYQNQGKVGAAVVSINTGEDCTYQLLLYRDKQRHVCNTMITRDFKFHIQPKNYCTFYDNQAIIWSILFDNPAEMADFSLQVALAKWKSGDSTITFLFQDLWSPIIEEFKSPPIAVGDNVELSYTIHSVTNVSQVLGERQNFKVTVEASGWKKALIGLQPTAKRAIILQPFLLGDLDPIVTKYQSPVVINLTVNEVGKLTEVSKLTESLISKDNEEFTNLATDLPKFKAETVEKSSTESPKGSPKATKADLITRMARMGQALPFKKAATTASDSDETEEDRRDQLRSNDRAVPKPRTRVQHPVALPPAPVQWAPAPYMGGAMYPAMPQMQSPVESQAQFNMFFSEVRTTNSELRMGLTRLTDKVENMQSKLENLEKRPSSETTSQGQLLEWQQQLKDQLERLLSALSATVQEAPSSSGLNAESPAPSVTLEPCRQCSELEQTVTSLTENLKKLQESNEYLQTTSSAQKDALQNARIAHEDDLARIVALEKQLEEERARNRELNERLQNFELEKARAEVDLQAANNLIKELQNTLQEKQMNIDKLEQSLRDSEETKIEEVRRNMQEILDPKPIVDEHVKKILNIVYKFIKTQFKLSHTYEASYIHDTVAGIIKGVALEYLESGHMPAESNEQLPNLNRKDKATISDQQTLSAPIEGLSQVVESTNGDQNEQQSQVKEETKMSAATVSTEVPPEPEITVLHNSSTASVFTESSITRDSEKNLVEESTANTTQHEPGSEKNDKSQEELSSFIAKLTDSSTSDMSEKLYTLLTYLSSSQTSLSSDSSSCTTPPTIGHKHQD